MQMWLEEWLRKIDSQLGWFDLAIFALAVLIFSILCFILFRRKKIHKEEYEKELKKQEEKYYKELTEVEAKHSKRIGKLEKEYTEVQTISDMSIYELNEEVCRLRAKELDEVKAFQAEIEKLKTEIGQAEMEITVLRKQMQSLIRNKI